MSIWQPKAIGLYDPRFEKDSCGVGFVADLNGRRRRDILDKSLEALLRCEHRGAVSSDGKTGDGAGVMTQLPDEFFAADLPALAPKLRPGHYGVGMFFLPTDAKSLQRCREVVEEITENSHLQRIGWREVPLDESAIGSLARSTCPHVEQFFVDRPLDASEHEFERRLYLLRRKIEARAIRESLDPFYIASFSSRTLAYKGLMVAGQLARFYPDLAHPLYQTAVAVFHQRYSTNTHPMWHLAQPFRLLAHNGEINTIQGNVLRMRAREPNLQGGDWTADQLEELRPLVREGGSDSACLDNVLELLVLSGRTPMHALAMLLPEAYKQWSDSSDEVRAFYDYHSGLVEPWDGPAALAVTDGRYAVAALDRNGLRPSRYWITDDGLVIVGSEAGLVSVPIEKIVYKGRLGPGQMLAVDMAAGKFLDNDAVKHLIASRRDYASWLGYRLNPGESGPTKAPAAEHLDTLPDGDFIRLQKAFGFGAEDVDRLLEPMMFEGKEPVGSMGDDSPIAALSRQPQPIYRYFKQMFAQVTNPPIDPLREKMVMSLDIQIFARGHLLEEVSDANKLLRFTSPVITEDQLAWLRSPSDAEFESTTLPCLFAIADGPAGLSVALEELCHRAEVAVNNGSAVLVLSDRGVCPQLAPIPMLLATAAVHHRLIRSRLRMKAAIVCEVGDAREDHHVACLVGYGASLVNPYMALSCIRRLAVRNSRKQPIPVATAVENYRRALDSGLLKILSKMGISTLASYRGAQNFEALGLGPELIGRHFTGTPSRIGGVELTHLASDVLTLHAETFAEPKATPDTGSAVRDLDADKLRDKGVYHYLSRDGEYHALNPLVFKSLHKAVRSNDPAEYDKYASLVNDRPACNIRDLLTWKKAVRPTPIADVEPVESIVARFCTQAMSHGAVSRETHEAMAVAMNRLNAKSNSGEGGEDPIRFKEYGAEFTPDPASWFAEWKPKAGDNSNSAIKQVASARFGVTPEYLVAAKEIEIKMAQGSKPGEGGQIPGVKVSEEIAAIRRSQPGATLISPPPHHDIYSIEDLSQLIFDLKRINREARIGVKLVSLVGVGTVAAGVVKGFADVIQISGHDGGTGASPLASIKYAGLPWELGLAEIQHTLVKNKLRNRVRLRVDGGFKTGRDVVIAALLGGEEFGFGTTALVALGCVMARRCHLNNCPVGIASQRPDLRAKFPGEPEHVVNFMLFVAQEVRLILSQLGLRSLDDAVGRSDLLIENARTLAPKAKLDLTLLLTDPDKTGAEPRRWGQRANTRPEVGRRNLDQIVWDDYAGMLPMRRSMVGAYEIENRDRSVGARLSGEIARECGGEGLPEGTVRLDFHGVAGQSFGVFCNRGMQLHLFGEAQDFVGKGMYGGEIVLRPPAGAQFAAQDAAIAGNTVLYGATGGRLFASGQVGERFCVRNSGGLAVVEGCGEHGCEYMTNGLAVVLGKIGRNFGAGMSGGVAFVLDADERYVNLGMVRIEPLAGEVDDRLLRAVLTRHLALTDSQIARELLDDWNRTLSRLKKIHPHPSIEEPTAKDVDDETLEQFYLRQLENLSLASPYFGPISARPQQAENIVLG